MSDDAKEILDILENAGQTAEPTAPAAPEAGAQPVPPPQPEPTTIDPKALKEWQAQVTQQTQANAEQARILTNIVQTIAANQQAGIQQNPQQIAAAVIAEQQRNQQQGSIWDIPDDVQVDGATMKAVLAQYGQTVASALQEVAGAVESTRQEVRQREVVTEMAREIEDATKRYPQVNKRALAGTVITTLRDSNPRSIKEAVEMSARMLAESMPTFDINALPEEEERKIALKYAAKVKAKAAQPQNFNPGGGQPPAAPVAKPLSLTDTAAIQARIEAGRQANLAKKGR